MTIGLDGFRGAACIIGVVLLLSACGGSNERPQPTSGPPPLPPPVDAGAPVATTPCDPVQSSAMTAAIQARAAAEAPGMKPEGAPLCGVVPEGGQVTGPSILLEQGYCYTVLGEGLPPVSEVDMVLQLDLATGMALPGPLAALGQSPLMVDTMQGLHAGMGTKAGCYQWTLPLPAQAKVVVKSAKGGPGPVAAQVNKKKK